MGNDLWSARHVAHVVGLSIATVCNATASGQLVGVLVQNGDGPDRFVYRPAAIRKWLRQQTYSNVTQRAAFILASQKLERTSL